jgi:hypothetical protein
MITFFTITAFEDFVGFESFDELEYKKRKNKEINFGRKEKRRGKYLLFEL